MAYRVRSTRKFVAQARDVNGKRIHLGTFTTLRKARIAEADYRERRENEVFAPFARSARANLAASRRLG